MKIPDGFISAIVEKADVIGFDESQTRKQIKEWTYASIFLIGLGLFLAIAFGAARQEVFWLFLAAVILISVLFSFLLILVASLRLNILAYLLVLLYLGSGGLLIANIPSDIFAMLSLFGGIGTANYALLNNLYFSVMKNEIKKGAVFPPSKSGKSG